MKTSRQYITASDLSIGYVQRRMENRLFSGLNLSLQAGEMICFMGPNGAGKSSLIRTLASLQKPLGGTIRYHGQESLRPEHQIAVVLTERVNAANMTVEEIVSFGRYPYLGWSIRLTASDKALIDAAISQVRIQHLLGKKLYELSDGQMQMVMIARALAQDTPVILLDEPTAHLDLNNRVEIMNLLRQLCRTTQKSILIATHELDLALQTADVIWLAGKNKDILRGLPEDLVLNGSFDEIFRFKGFDLKSGKIIHPSFRELKVQLTGEGPAYLWTKNALERTGFDVREEQQDIAIAVTQDSSLARWTVKKNGQFFEADSIETLLNLL